MLDQTLERRHINHKTAAAPSDKAQGNQPLPREPMRRVQPQRFEMSQWVPVQRDFCRFPPIRGYEGRADDRLTPREALVFLGLRDAVHQQVRTLRHAAGMAGGEAAGANEREHGKLLDTWFKTNKLPEGVKRPKKETHDEVVQRDVYREAGIKGKCRSRRPGWTWRSATPTGRATKKRSGTSYRRRSSPSTSRRSTS
jgi:hypothetical protein